MNDTEKMTMTTTKFELFHAKKGFLPTSLTYDDTATKEDIQRAFIEGQYESVHTFELPAENPEVQMEAIYYQSQNLEGSWRGDSVCRSTSVGDVIRVDNRYWIVGPEGFDFGW